MKSKYLSIIKSIAPEVVKALVPGGPFINMGIRVLSETLLGKPDGTEADIEAFLEKASPEQLGVLKDAEVRMKALDVDFAKVEADDRDNARKRHIAMKDNIDIPGILAVVFSIGYFVMVGAILKWGIPTGSETIVVSLATIMSAMELSIGNYYFGSSSGSAKKNATIAGLMK